MEWKTSPEIWYYVLKRVGGKESNKVGGASGKANDFIRLIADGDYDKAVEDFDANIHDSIAAGPIEVVPGTFARLGSRASSRKFATNSRQFTRTRQVG